MTKQEEIQMIKNIVNNLPDNSYIKSIMEETLPEMEWLVSSDFIMPLSIRDIQIQKHAAQADVDELKAKASELKDEIKSLAMDKARHERAIDDIKSALRRINI